MCGRYRLTAKERWLSTHFNLDPEDVDWAARCSVPSSGYGILRLAFEWELIPRMPVVHQLPGERSRDRVLCFHEEEKYLAAAGAKPQGIDNSGR